MQLLTAMLLSQRNGRIKRANAHTALPTVPGMQQALPRARLRADKVGSGEKRPARATQRRDLGGSETRPRLPAPLPALTSPTQSPLQLAKGEQDGRLPTSERTPNSAPTSEADALWRIASRGGPEEC